MTCHVKQSHIVDTTPNKDILIWVLRISTFTDMCIVCQKWAFDVCAKLQNSIKVFVLGRYKVFAPAHISIAQIIVHLLS